MMEEERGVSRGRPRVPRIIRGKGPFRCFGPQCHFSDSSESVTLLPEELELLRLVDLEGMEQEEAANLLGVSRRTVWRDLHEVRRKIADALIHGKNIEMRGCSFENDVECPKFDANTPNTAKGRFCR
ncbi:MAG: DUF134 domain-containing protein [Methanomicrobiales archaeon]|nr:DUF134 domain-containing protein [Methanomicrobiales archaeon]